MDEHGCGDHKAELIGQSYRFPKGYATSPGMLPLSVSIRVHPWFMHSSDPYQRTPYF
jgi:hypothetical protein